MIIHPYTLIYIQLLRYFSNYLNIWSYIITHTHISKYIPTFPQQYFFIHHHISSPSTSIYLTIHSHTFPWIYFLINHHISSSTTPIYLTLHSTIIPQLYFFMHIHKSSSIYIYPHTSTSTTSTYLLESPSSLDNLCNYLNYL